MAYRLVGRESTHYYSEQYGVLLGDLEYSFSFNMESGTVDEAIAITESIVATCEFNP